MQNFLARVTKWPSLLSEEDCLPKGDRGGQCSEALLVRKVDFDSVNEMAAWRSGNGVGHINEFTLRRARLVLGWVTCPRSTPGGGTLFRYVTSHPGRLSLSSFQGR